MEIDYKTIEKKANEMQLLALKFIEDTFTERVQEVLFMNFSEIKNPKNSQFIFEIKLGFKVLNYKLEFYLYPDQLEFYISDSNSKILSECNLEDFGTNDEIFMKYKNYLTDSLKKLRITN